MRISTDDNLYPSLFCQLQMIIPQVQTLRMCICLQQNALFFGNTNDFLNCQGVRLSLIDEAACRVTQNVDSWMPHRLDEASSHFRLGHIEFRMDRNQYYVHLLEDRFVKVQRAVSKYIDFSGL